MGVRTFRARRVDAAFTPASADEPWELSTAFGPVRTLDDERREDLRARFLALVERHRTDEGIRQSRTYLLTLGRRR
ncbi:MAG: hypothetical protein KY396_02085 [Actinobacteria bacterium]|nr:hypothetical protein [Actinomycetota bacterium]